MAGRRLVVLGGGFGGLDVVRAIGRSRAAREYWDTVLVDKENFFQFNPLLPAVAVGAVETRHIVYPLRDAARHRHFRFVKNKAIAIDLGTREVRLHNRLVLPYEVLVIAVGSVTHHYGIPGAAEHARPFKTLVDAMTLRARVVELFEMAEQAETREQRRRLLSFAIVGGGVTGVEVASELMDMARDTLLPKYPSLHRADLTVTVIEGGDRVVPTAMPAHSRYVERFLDRRGIALRLNTRVTKVETGAIHLQGGDVLGAFTIVWTAGVRPPNLVLELPVEHVRDGRLAVDEFLRVRHTGGAVFGDVYAIGDVAAGTMPDGTLTPTLAQNAVAMGHAVGDTLVRRASDRAPRPYSFKQKGYIISLGQHSSVVDLFGLPVSGRLAWLMWAGYYLVTMVGFRKQLEVAIDHVSHLFFQHDTSQILNRRAVLTDEELNLTLGSDTQPSPHPDADVGMPSLRG